MQYSGINTVKYPGDGLRFPINQDLHFTGAWFGNNALLSKPLASKYFKRQHGIKNNFADEIVSLPQYSQVVPSFQSQYGRGKRKTGRGKTKIFGSLLLGTQPKLIKMFRR